MVADSLLGRVLAGKYEIQRRIGAGGMGVVYEAVELDLGRRVALKVLQAGYEPRDLARLRTEVLAMAAASHPNVVQLLDCGTEHDPPFVVMELLRGRTLAMLLAQEGALPPARAVRICVQILSALSTAHAAGVLHRDVKPSNVFVIESPGMEALVKVLDFGLAKLEGGGASRTTTGAVLGTPSYMAPEQILAAPPDVRTDVFAAGVCLFEMLSGRRPFAAFESAHVDAPGLASVRPDLPLPLPLAAVVACALARDPARRFPSADAMSRALLGLGDLATFPAPMPSHATVGAGSVLSTSTGSKARSSPALVFAVAFLGVALLGAVVAAVFLGRAALRPSGEPYARAPSSSSVAMSSSSGAPLVAPQVPSAAPSALTGPPSRRPTLRPPTGPAPTPTPRASASAEPGPLVPVTSATVGMASYTSEFFRDELPAIERAAPEVARCAADPPGVFVAKDQITVRVDYAEGTGKPTWIIGYNRPDGAPPMPASTLGCLDRAVAHIGFHERHPSGPVITRIAYNLR